MGDVEQWLIEIGLGQYSATLADHDIDFDTLPQLTEQDLRELGFSIGHRKKFFAAIKHLSVRSPDQEDTGASDASLQTEAERRQLTVMFCDLVGSTALSERLDPEDLREVIHTYQECCAAVVARFGSFIARYMGDGLLVYFGYPQAHEDDVERAIRAGLGIVEAVGELRLRENLKLQVRIGIATGLVVAGDHIGTGASEEKAVVGETPNLAARLQSIAEPNTVVIAPATYRLAGGLFEYKDLGNHDFKGISTPVRAWRVVGETAAESRFDAAHAAGMTPLVGREEEINLLLKRWDQAKEGDGQVVLLSGEAGVGKSRILRSFRERLEDELRNQVLYYCSFYHQNSAFFPAIDQLERGLRFEKDDDAAEKLDKLEAVLGALGLPVPEIAPLLASLLSLPADDRYPPSPLSAEELKKKILEALVAVFDAMASQDPVLMVIEDVHWIDPSTLELLTLFIEQLRSARVVLVVTYRPEFESPWGGHVHVTGLTLNRLSRRESAAMIVRVAGGKAVPEAVLDEIVAKTDGVPLFIEELTKTVLESDLLDEFEDRYVLPGPLPPLAIPASLQDSLMARLDRLAPVKEVAQLAATLGRTFSHELLAAVSPLKGEKLEDALSQLLGAGLIYRHGLPPDVTYDFKHTLVRDVAYQSLLMGNRLQFHRRIAHALEERFPGTEPELLAHHYSAGRAPREAIACWKRAAEQAFTHSAHLEAASHVRHALQMLDQLDEVAERLRLELELVMQLGTALRATHGYAASEVENLYLRGRELSKQIGETPERFNVEWALMQFFLVQGNLESANEVATSLLDNAEKHQDRLLLMDAYLANGMVEFHLGDFDRARKYLEQGVALYRPDVDQPRLFTHGQDPGIFCISYLAWTLWFLGYPDQAKDRIEEIMVLARKTSHTFSRVSALTFAVRVHHCRRDAAAVIQLTEDLIAMARHSGYAYYEALGTIHQGWALAIKDRGERGIAQMREGLNALERTGTVLGLRGFLVQLAEGYVRLGMNDEALLALAKTENRKKGWGTHCWDAEIERVRGEILAIGGRTEQKEAETAFRSGLDIARRQRAWSLELRIAVSYSRMLQRQTRREEARNLLGQCLKKFDEGRGTVDQLDAWTLMKG